MFDKVTKSIRVISAAAVEKANSGHPGMPMGMAEVGTVLFKNALKISNKYSNNQYGAYLKSLVSE